MLKRLYLGIRFILTGKSALSIDSQKAIEDFIFEFDKIPSSKMGDSFTQLFEHWSKINSSTYHSLSKSFHKRFSDSYILDGGHDKTFVDNLRKGKI